LETCGSTSTANTCPPSKATSTLMWSSANAHHLREHSVNGVRVDERDLEPEEPTPRMLVDQLRAVCRELAQGLADIVDLVGDVVHPRPPLGEKLPDRSLGAERREQLDAIRADPQRCGLDALARNRLAVLELGAEEALVGCDRLVEILDRDAEVMDSARLHAADAIGLLRSDYAYGPNRFGRLRFRFGAFEERRQLVLVERLLVEQGERDSVEGRPVLLQ
jgi:hypothetical protein